MHATRIIRTVAQAENIFKIIFVFFLKRSANGTRTAMAIALEINEKNPIQAASI